MGEEKANREKYQEKASLATFEPRTTYGKEPALKRAGVRDSGQEKWRLQRLRKNRDWDLARRVDRVWQYL